MSRWVIELTVKKFNGLITTEYLEITSDIVDEVVKNMDEYTMRVNMDWFIKKITITPEVQGISKVRVVNLMNDIKNRIISDVKNNEEFNKLLTSSHYKFSLK